jgi:hypothetical protein
MTSHPPARVTEQLLHRVCAEFLEMPGLRLTLKQAQRLWGLDEETCTRSLEALVEARFLVRVNRGAYARLTEGSSGLPAFRMAKASLELSRARNVRAS